MSKEIYTKVLMKVSTVLHVKVSGQNLNYQKEISVQTVEEILMMLKKKLTSLNYQNMKID